MQISIVHSILATLAWYDLFNHPLTAQEIRYYLDQQVDESGFQTALSQLLQEHRVFNHGGFYSLQNDTSLVTRRKQYNQRAKDLLPLAHRVGKLLSGFPYVSGVCISGSLSKNVAGPDADLDFFIIVQPGRLWIARTMMHILKKLSFLAGKQHWFCMNYYIDESSPVIKEQNFFTAIEMLTLMPVAGNAMEHFFQANDWVADYLPAYTYKDVKMENSKKGLPVRLIEKLFSGNIGNKLEAALMNLTVSRWKKKEDEHRLNMKGGRMGLDAGAHYCKPNPVHFQVPLMERYQQRVTELLDQHFVMVS